MSRNFLTPPAFTCKTRCISALSLALGLLSTAALFVLYALASLRRVTLLLSCLIEVGHVLSGILGLVRSTPAVVASFMMAIGSCFGCALLGGLCILFLSNIELEVVAVLDKAFEQRDVEDGEKLLSDTKNILRIAAAVLIVNAVANLCFSWYLRRLLGERRASIAFLQMFSVIMLPLSLYLILGGNYIVDTGTLASAPYAGLAIFASGVLLLVVALLAFIGGTFEYRRLLSICYMVSALIGACAIVLAITCLAGRDFVERNVLDNWKSIRIFLPPTAQVAYDRDRFAAVMRSHLTVGAYVGLVSGLFILSEAGMSLALMHHVSSWKQQVARAKGSTKDLEQTAVRLDPIDSSSSVNLPGSLLAFLHQWTKHFDLSTRQQRLVMRIVLVLIVLAVAFILAVMCANVIFAAKCSSIGSLLASTSFPLVNSSAEAATRFIQVKNSFSRGELVLVAAASTAGNVDIDAYGSSGVSLTASNMYTKMITNDAINVEVRPVDTTRFLWLDGSCQRSVMQVSLPQDPLRSLVVNSNTSVVVNGSVTLEGLSITTMQSSIVCSKVQLQGDKLLLQSTSGDISAENLTIDASNSSAAESPVRISSALGFVSLSNIVLSQCDLQVETGASSLTLSNIHSSVNTGRSHIEAKSSSASVSVADIQANWITLISEKGDIDGIELLVEDNSAFMGRLEATTISGDISLNEITASGTVHVESASGNILVQINTQTFAGMFYMRSDHGTISIRQSNYSSDVIVESADSLDGLEKRGSINCDPAINNCLAYGHLYLHSNFGNIEIVLGCNSYSCS